MKFLNLLLCMMCLYTPYATSSENTNIKNDAGYLACKQVIFDYTELRDNGPTKAYGELFTQDSVFEVKALNILLKGRTEISNRHERALKATKTVHTITSVKIDSVSDDVYKSHANFTLSLQKLPAEKFKVSNIKGYYDDLLKFDGKQCRIVSRQVIIETQQP